MMNTTDKKALATVGAEMQFYNQLTCRVETGIVRNVTESICEVEVQRHDGVSLVRCQWDEIEGPTANTEIISICPRCSKPAEGFGGDVCSGLYSTILGFDICRPCGIFVTRYSQTGRCSNQPVLTLTAGGIKNGPETLERHNLDETEPGRLVCGDQSYVWLEEKLDGLTEVSLEEWPDPAGAPWRE